MYYHGVNMPAEVLRSGARLGQPDSIAVAALNLFESRAKRDALIDRVVSFGTAVPKSTTSEIPVFRGEVLKTPVALDYTTGVINVTPPIPEDPRKDLSHDSVKNRRPSLWRRALITGVAVASGLTAVGTASPSPTEASGNMKLVTASSEGINCVEDKSLLVIDFKYAAELVKGIASGEILIASGDGIAAAIIPSEGDKTAVIQPITITPGEVWQNLVKVVPQCPVVVKPTPAPTPRETPRPTPKIKDVDTFLRTKTKPIDAQTTEGFIKKWVASDQLIKDGYDADNIWGSCKDGDRRGDPYSTMADACKQLTTRAYERYKQTGNMKAYNAAVSVKNYGITHIPDAYGFKGQLRDYMDGIFG